MKLKQMQRGTLLVVVFSLLAWGTIGIADASSTPSAWELRARKQMLLLVPELDYSLLEAVDQDPALFPNMHRLLQSGGVGAVSARTLGNGVEDLYASLGAGAPAGSDKGAYGLNRNEEKAGVRADRLYARLRGVEGSGEEEVIVPEFARTERVTGRLGFAAVPGLLGESLERAQSARFLYGNADTDSRSRYAALVLSDRMGRVEHGNVGSEVLVPAADWPFGVRMDGTKLAAWWRVAPADAVVAIEWGDWSRLEAERLQLTEARYEEQKLVVWRELDAFVGEIVEHSASGEGLWIMSAGKVNGVKQPGTLLPLLYYELGMNSGLLESTSTRRPGIVTLYDVSASLLSRYGMGIPPEMLGRPLEVAEASDGAWLTLRQELRGIRSVYVLRPQLLLPFAGYEAIVLLASLLLAVWTPREGGRRLKGLLCLLLLSLLAAPLAMLVLGWAVHVRLLEPSVLVAAFFALVAIGSLAGARYPLRAAVVLAALTAAALLVDGLTGAEGMKRSLLGYDPVVGARFYGMGNEYMGVLLGATVLAVSAGLQLLSAAARRAPASALPAPAGSPGAPSASAATPEASQALPQPLAPRAVAARLWRERRASRVAAAAAVVAYAGVALYLAAPALGSEAGGAIAGAVAFGHALRRSLPRLLRPSPAGPALRAASRARRLRRPAPGRAWLRSALLTASLVALALIGLWLLNAVMPPPAGRASHIGNAMEWLRTGRFDLIEAMISRKLRMNLHLLGVSAWSKVLLAGLLVMLAAVLRPREKERWRSSHPYLMDGCSAITIGAIAALVLNDSGIVAGGTMIIYAAIPLLLLKLQDE
ncbi:hypothetical protein [Paenibacillus sp. HJGM_3]|uniref:hypothetical protein n=1 Tax=Paenibacillus sp. HJGM_3 TaxID=3379816 RepID=UPI00385B7991